MACSIEKGFLFADTTRLPCAIACTSAAAVASVAVQSTTIVPAPSRPTTSVMKAPDVCPSGLATHAGPPDALSAPPDDLFTALVFHHTLPYLGSRVSLK